MLTDTETPLAGTDTDGPALEAAAPAPAPAHNPIPTEAERPRYVVLDELHKAADGTHYRPGVWHFGTKPGRGDAPPTLTQHWICSPVHVQTVTFDSAGNNYGRLLRFCSTRGQWREWAMPMEMLKGDGAELRGALLSMGVHIDTGRHSRDLLAAYLQAITPQRTMLAVLQTGWAGGDFKAFALPDVVLGPRANGVTFQAQGLHADEYTMRGTLPGWCDAIAAPAVGNPVLVLGLCAAFAGPVLALVGVESGCIHLIGDSSTGKTTALQAACSVWGGESYRRSWRATANGLEASASLFNDCLLALDEISECDPRDVGNVVYMLGNGRGKARASRTGSARTVACWRSSVLSTGLKATHLRPFAKRCAVCTQGVDRSGGIFVAQCDSVGHAVGFGGFQYALHRIAKAAPIALCTCGHPALGGQQHERLQVDAQVHPLRMHHALVHQHDQPHRRAEEAAVLCQLLQARGLVVARDVDGAV